MTDEQIMAFVKSAYLEGWRDGHHEGISCGHPLNRCSHKGQREGQSEYEYSYVRDEAEKALAPSTGDGGRQPCATCGGKGKVVAREHEERTARGGYALVVERKPCPDCRPLTPPPRQA